MDIAAGFQHLPLAGPRCFLEVEDAWSGTIRNVVCLNSPSMFSFLLVFLTLSPV